MRVAGEHAHGVAPVDQPADEALHLRHVRGMQFLSLPTIFVGTPVVHDPDADGPGAARAGS